MEGKNGAIVAMDPHTGEILAMVSRPTFDPNQFSVRLTRNYWNQIINDPEPSADEQDHPGPARAWLHLQDHHVARRPRKRTSRRTCTSMCNGGATFFGHFFACDKHHGMVDIDHAIPWSCDTFYYTLAEPPRHRHHRQVRHLGRLSQKTGIDLPDEVSGTMPSTAWKLKTQHEKWYAGEVISVGIGQGAVTVTPHPARARARRHRLRRRAQAPARRLSRRASTGDAPDHPRDLPRLRRRTIPITPDNWETHHRRHGRRPPTARRHRLRRRTWKASTSPARPAPPRS